MAPKLQAAKQAQQQAQAQAQQEVPAFDKSESAS
jgi:hypothetical protein